MNKFLFGLLCGFCIGIAPWLFQVADTMRPSPGTGGEIFILILPLLLLPLFKREETEEEEWR